MSVTYQAISFNRQKKIYDTIIAIAILLYMALFLALSIFFYPNATIETLLIRCTGSLGFILLTIILCIGPLSRLHNSFIPLLYNRRHLGVSMFFIALAHASIAIIQFHGFGDINPLHSIFLSNTNYFTLNDFPFQTLGFFALCILFLMAASSHDFWLANLNPYLWKSLHMLAYLAYALIIMHIALGSLQSEMDPLLVLAVSASLGLVFSLHIISIFKLQNKKVMASSWASDGYAFVCKVSEIPENRARIIELLGERVAVFSYNNQISAVSNVCKHQNGPLGEGRIIDDCITCPWHGFQYRPEDGQSPPPFKEKIATFKVRIEGDKVYVNPKALPEGTYVEAAKIPTR